MSEKELSGEEKRRILREQFKKDLQERKKFMQKVQDLGKEKRILNALENMKHEDDSDEWIAKLNEESAFADARYEIAMNTAGNKNNELKYDADLEKAVAEQLVAQLKAQMLGEAELGELVEDAPAVEAVEIGDIPDAQAAELPVDEADTATRPPAEKDADVTNVKPSRKMLDGIE